jgi:sigma-B regulation protein RsbU (phosphoserine phosphatase)
MRLLRAAPPPLAGLDLASSYEPSQSVVGDYYDFIPLSTDRLGIAVADVSGKGLSSALLMASLQGLMHNNTTAL